MKNKDKPSKTDEDLRRERERHAREFAADGYDLYTINDYIAGIIAVVGKVNGEKPAAQRKYLTQVAVLAIAAVEKSYREQATEPDPK